jgi:hypothetical protein
MMIKQKKDLKNKYTWNEKEKDLMISLKKLLRLLSGRRCVHRDEVKGISLLIVQA